jgi:hypothetical protein
VREKCLVPKVTGDNINFHIPIYTIFSLNFFC